MDTNSEIKQFCAIVRQRSSENKQAMKLLSNSNALSPQMSIVRQELDSMIRVIYLLKQDIRNRTKIIKNTLAGKKWPAKDFDMVCLALELQGWTQSVYNFGCGFIHLSSFHNYLSTKPFDHISPEEKQDILQHLRNYHGGPLNDNPTWQELACLLPAIFDKVAGNLECYIKHLEDGDAPEVFI